MAERPGHSRPVDGASDTELESGDPGFESSSSSQTVPAVTSLLDRLKAPQPSQLARKRKLTVNPRPPVGVKKGKGRVSSAPTSVSPADRVRGYPGENLAVSNKALFCLGCREEVSVKKSVLELHIKSQKHLNGKKRLELKGKREADIAMALRKYDSEHHLSGETLPESTRVYRVKVVTTLLQAGVPLSKADVFRDLLQENAFNLSDSSNLRKLIPFILQDEISKIKQDIEGRPVAIIFDGTTHVCEAFVIVIRYIRDWVIKQRVCRLTLLAKSMTGEEVARQLITVVSTELSVPPDKVVAAMRDRASVNNVAMRTISVIYNLLMDIGCFSHTLDHVGERMRTPILHDFTRAWISLFSHSPKSRVAWRTRTGLPCPSYSATRWWSKFEVMHQLHDTFGDIAGFVRECDLPSATASKLLEVLNDQGKLRKLKMELAITIDAMHPFVKFTYELEGDGPLVLIAYERISTLHHHVSSEHYPNVLAVASSSSAGNLSHEQQLIAYAKNCAAPAYDYFREKFDNDLKPIVQAFKTARYFVPSKIHELNPTSLDIDSLTAFPFLNVNSIIDGLKSELPAYFTAAEDVSSGIDVIEWWKLHEHELPNWAYAFRLVLLVQPTSAAAERVFSLLSSSFGAQQASSLEDYVELSVMLQYNRNRSD